MSGWYRKLIGTVDVRSALPPARLPRPDPYTAVLNYLTHDAEGREWWSPWMVAELLHYDEGAVRRAMDRLTREGVMERSVRRHGKMVWRKYRLTGILASPVEVSDPPGRVGGPGEAEGGGSRTDTR